MNILEFYKDFITKYMGLVKLLFYHVENQDHKGSVKVLMRMSSIIKDEYATHDFFDLFNLLSSIELLTIKFSRLEPKKKVEFYIQLNWLLKKVYIKKYIEEADSLNPNEMKLFASDKFEPELDFSELNSRSAKSFLKRDIDKVLPLDFVRYIIPIFGLNFVELDGKPDILKIDGWRYKEPADSPSLSKKVFNISKTNPEEKIENKNISSSPQLFTTDSMETEVSDEANNSFEEKTEIHNENSKKKKVNKFSLSEKHKQVANASKKILKAGLKYGANKIAEEVSDDLVNAASNVSPLIGNNPELATKVTKKVISKGLGKAIDKTFNKMDEKRKQNTILPGAQDIPEYAEPTAENQIMSEEQPSTQVNKKIEISFTNLDPRSILLKKVRGNILLNGGIEFGELMRMLGVTDVELKDMIYFLAGESLLRGSFIPERNYFKIEGDIQTSAEAIIKYVDSFLLKEDPDKNEK